MDGVNLYGLPDDAVHVFCFCGEYGGAVELNTVFLVDAVLSYGRLVRIFQRDVPLYYTLIPHSSNLGLSTSSLLGLVSYEFVPIQELSTSLCNQLALVHPEDGGDTILRNVGSYKSHMVLFPRR
jgi:hypothetical protein